MVRRPKARTRIDVLPSPSVVRRMGAVVKVEPGAGVGALHMPGNPHHDRGSLPRASGGKLAPGTIHRSTGSAVCWTRALMGTVMWMDWDRRARTVHRTTHHDRLI